MLNHSVEAEPASLVRPIHTAVLGRARFHVQGLQRHADMKRRLEHRLATAAGVRHVSASTVTSNVLVHFDPAIPLGHIARRLAAALTDRAPDANDDRAQRSEARHWHAMSFARAAEELQTSSAEGLSNAEAQRRLATHGRNSLAALVGRSNASILVDQFKSLPVALLAVAAVVSLATGGAALEAGAIFAVIGLNATVGFLTESRSERTIQGLARTAHAATRVIRDGRPVEVEAHSVVPGDLLALQRGSLIPADARVVSASELTVSEALLTGESFPMTKTSKVIAERRPLADRTNMVYRGTVVTGGSGTAVVVATGAQTEAGRVQQLIAAAGTPETPMQRQLSELGGQLVWLSTMVCSGVFGLGLLRGFAFVQMLRSATSLAVAAIPEGLPAVATTSLAIGIEEMRRRDVLVRRLDAVETLAAVQVICFDKTGTVTLNEMAVAKIVCGASPLLEGDASRVGSATDPRLARLLEVAVLCNETRIENSTDGQVRLNGSATENALVQRALTSGVDVVTLRRRYPTLLVRQRTESYRFMATVHAAEDAAAPARLVAVKGSPSEVLKRCRWELGGDLKPQPLTEVRRAAIERANAEMAEDALRVLGFAYQEHDPSVSPAEVAIEDLIWLGLVGLADPVRPGMRELMATFHRAGVRTVLVTGDQKATARSVARELGLSETGDIEALDADDLDRLQPGELAAAARRAHVFARVSPAQKLRIVRALQQAGLIVAMTGDGVNDGPALKAAEIGIALGRNGTDAAREVADVVLETDDLTALAAAVEYGRATNTNIRKTIHYLLSTNLSEILVVLAATAIGAGEALTPMQLLWINLVSDVLPALALTCEPPPPDAMERGPLPANQPILQRPDFAMLAGEAAVLGAGAMAAGALGTLRYGWGSAQSRSMLFTSLVTAQMLHAVTCRRDPSDTSRRGALPPNRLLTGALALSFAAQAAALIVPGLRTLLGVAPLGPLDVAMTLACGVLPFLANGAANKLASPAPRAHLSGAPPGCDSHAQESLAAS